MSVLVFMAYTAYKKSSANTDDTSYYGYSPNWIITGPESTSGYLVCTYDVTDSVATRTLFDRTLNKIQKDLPGHTVVVTDFNVLPATVQSPDP